MTHVDALFESLGRRYRLDPAKTVWSVTKGGVADG